MIKPTVGRNVHVYRNKGNYDQGLQPMHGNVLYVWNDRMINVAGWDKDGDPYFYSSCVLVQEGDPVPEYGYFAVWMPYQTAKAKEEATA